MKKQKKIVLAYSGGLDTSIILKWLQENYDAEVIAYTADVGQEMDRKKIIKNAKKLGVKKIIIQDLKNIFVKDYFRFCWRRFGVDFVINFFHFFKRIVDNFFNSTFY